MSYQKQGFHSGGDLYASQLEAMEDGIINAEKLAMEAASQGAQADYNENDSASASYIKNRPFYEELTFDPISWDGVIGDKATIDLSVTGAPSGTLLVKVSDQILSYEDFLGSVLTVSNEQSTTFTADMLSSKEEAEQAGGYGSNEFAVVSIFDTEKINATFGINVPETGTGTYFISISESDEYVKSLSKQAILKKIDEKFLPELPSGANMEKGTGTSATQQLPDGVAEGFDFTGKNPNAEAIDNTLSAVQPYGATGEFSAAFGGKASAQSRRSFACGTTTIAKGKYSFAAGENTVALGNSSSAEGMQTTSVGYAAHAQNGLTVAQGDSSHAQNYMTKAIGTYSTATGVETVAEGIASFTAGRGTKATIDSQMVVGRYNNNMGALFEVGNGTSDENRKTAFAVLENGSVWVSKTPTEDNHVVRLTDLTATIDNSISIIGLRKTTGSSVSQKQANASGDASAAFNQGRAINALTFAAGVNTEASGYGATAFGVNTVSKNAYGFTTGEGTQTGLDCQTVVGKYNLGTQGLFEVGCGDGEANRQNGFAVTADGYIIIKRPGTNEYYYLSKLFDSLNAWVDAAKV